MNILENIRQVFSPVKVVPPAQATSERKIAVQSEKLTGGITSYSSARQRLIDSNINYYALEVASTDPVFLNCFTAVKSLAFSNSWKVRGEQEGKVGFYQHFLETYNFNGLLDQVFNEHFSGVGRSIIYFEPAEDDIPRLVFRPYYIEGKQVVFPITQNGKVIGYEITNQEMQVQKRLSPDRVYNIQLNQGKYGYSILQNVLAFIDLKNVIIEAQTGTAKRGNQGQGVLSPNLAGIPDAQKQGILTQFNMWAKEMRNALKSGDKISASSIPVNITDLTLSNNDLQLMELLGYIDRQIYLGCGLNGTYLNTDNSNRASAEQGKDNLIQTTIRFWQQQFRGIGEWLLMQLPDFEEGKYFLEYEEEETKESLEVRGQNMQVLMQLVPSLQSLGYQVKDESVQALAHTLDLEIVNPNQEGQDQQQPNFFLNRIVNTQGLPVSQYQRIADKESVSRAKTLFRKGLKAQLVDFFNKRAFIDDQQLQPLINFISREEIERVVFAIARDTENDFEAQYQLGGKLTQAQLDTLGNLIELTLNGRGDYKGIEATLAKEVEAWLRANNNTIPNLSVIDNFVNNSVRRIEDGMFTSIYNRGSRLLATNNGLNWVGQVTQGDERVRQNHIINDNRAWERGRRSPNGSPDPMADFNCRCSYYYNTRQVLLEAGFSLFE
jgi:hypothetical protein